MPYGQRQAAETSRRTAFWTAWRTRYRDIVSNEHTGQFGGRVNRSVVARLGDQGGPVASYLAEPSIGGTTA